MRRIGYFPAVLLAVLALAGCAQDAMPKTGSLERGLTADEIKQLEVVDRSLERASSCLTERGWEITVHEDGWEVSGLTESQKPSYEQDAADCQEEAGMNEIAPLEMSAERMQRYYEYEVGLAECLREQGVAVEEIPSEQAFLDAYGSSDPWFAYKFADPAVYSQAEWEALETECPPYGSVG